MTHEVGVSMCVQSTPIVADREAPPPDDPDSPGALSAREAAALLGVDERTVRRAIARGDLAATKRGRAFHILPGALERYRRHRAAPPAARLPLRVIPDPYPANAEPDGRASLPRPLTSFVGRQREVASVANLLRNDAVRLVTLTGPGGVGKTRLALAVAAELAPAFADGAAFVPLAAVADPARALPTVARALGMREVDGEATGARLAALLEPRELLLVLDNLEHLPGTGPAVAALLAVCPCLTILATSRAPLGVSGERLSPVPPLSLPAPADLPAAAAGNASQAGGAFRAADAAEASEAVRLFVERARAVRPDVDVASSKAAAAVAAICRRLDGLPLAIELAAARTHLFDAPLLLARLERRLPLLTDGPTDQPPRLRSLRAAIEWSHELLSPDEQTLFRRLAVFAGGFPLDASEAVLTNRGVEESRSRAARPTHSPTPRLLDSSTPVIDRLAALVRHSLVDRVAGDRFAMLETVREFARERLEVSGEAQVIARRHAAYFAALVERIDPVLPGPRERELTAQLEAELDNLRAAVTWGFAHDIETVLRIGGGLWGFWNWSGRMAEGRRWLEPALANAQAEAASPQVRARALVTAEAIRVLQGEFVPGLPWVAASLPLWREAGDRVGEGIAFVGLATEAGFHGRLDEAISLAEDAQRLLAGATTPRDQSWQARVAGNLGYYRFAQGNRAHGLASGEEAVRLARQTGSATVLLSVLSEFGILLLAAGERDRARSALTESLAVAWAGGVRWLVAAPLFLLGAVEVAEGRAAEGVRLIGAGGVIAARHAVVLPPNMAPTVDGATAQAEQVLGAKAFTAARIAGRAWPVAAAVASVLGEPSETGADASGLTDRQRQVLRLLAEGQSDKEIAAALSVARPTASKHVANILAALGAPSRAAAVARAVRAGLV